jgi:hypothetical protein
MKEEFKIYKEFWNIVDQLDLTKLSENVLKTILRNNLTADQSRKLDEDLYNLMDLISSDIKHLCKKRKVPCCEERLRELSSNSLGMGYEFTQNILNEDSKSWKILLNLKVHLNYEIPFDFEYEKDLNETAPIIKESEDRIQLLRDKGKHLTEEYIESLEKDLSYFKNALSEENLEKYNKDEMYEKIKESQKLGEWASHIIAIEEKKSFNDGGINIVGYEYPNTIEEILSSQKAKGIKIKF